VSAQTGPCILVVEDDANLRLALRDNLEDSGYRVREAATLAQAGAQLAEAGREGAPVALVILDVMLPDGDGYRWCAQLRAAGARTPVVMLTARTLEDDVVRGFEVGAQDYLAKPYRVRELLARVGAQLRRAAETGVGQVGVGPVGAGPAGAPASALTFAGYRVDLARRTVAAPDGAAVELTRTEFDLLVYLVQHRERALKRDELLDAVWGEGVVVDPRTVDNFIYNLKKKLGWTSASRFTLLTVRGVGYRMEVDGEG
jgi:DNA-binding response OmpR family regulator